MKEFLYDNLKDWEVEIVERYPEIYLDPSPYIESMLEEYYKDQKTVNLRYGFEFAEGWKGLVEEYSMGVMEILKRVKEATEFDPESYYIKGCIMKEKFGKLTIQNYYNLPTTFVDEYRDFTYALEAKSAKICEKCGEPANIAGVGVGFCGWIRCLCENCRKNIK